MSAYNKNNTEANVMRIYIFFARETHVHQTLNEILEFIVRRDEISYVASLTNQLHIWPDYHGNRSPIANPDLRGMVCLIRFTQFRYHIILIDLTTIGCVTILIPFGIKKEFCMCPKQKY